MAKPVEELLAYDFALLLSRRSGLLPHLSKRRQRRDLAKHSTSRNSKASSFR